MASFNSVTLVGNICADIEVRDVGSAKVATLRLAVNESYKSKSGEKVEKTVFVDCDAWDRQAETCAQFLSKGSPCLVSGRLQMDEWADKVTDDKRSKLKVRADRVVFLGFSKDGDQAERKTRETFGEQAPAVPTQDEEIPF